MSHIHKLLLRLFLGTVLMAGSLHAANTVVWNPATERVDADVRGMTLWPFLENLAHQTGWHIYVEPGTDKIVSTKFKNLPAGDAMKMIFGDLNYALVPGTNGPTSLYVFLTAMQNATRAVATRKPANHVPNELIVKIRPGANIDAIAKLVGAKIIGRNDKLGIYRLQFPDAATTDAALAQLQNDPDVLAVDYNYYFDPPPPMQAAASGSTVQPPVSLKLDAPSQDNPCNVLVGLIDTPIQTLSPNLAQFVQPQISVAGTVGSLGSTPTHATGMAQTILRAISSSSGGNSSAQILPVDVYGSDPTTTSWNVALGIQAAVDKGANVLNLSLGSTTDSAILENVIQQAEASGVLIFAAAGNEPVNTPTYPAADPGVNAVTALQQGQLASYANFGSFIDMALPGTSVIYQGNQPWIVQGTSVSTAYATGIAAGTKTSNCDGWPQIQTAMQQKFLVPMGK